MKLLKKRLSAAIAIALTLILVASFIALPVTFGQTAPHPKIAMSAGTSDNLWVGPTPVGINQNILIQGLLRPMPLGYSQDQSKSAGNIYYNLTFRIGKPDRTYETVLKNSDNRSEV